MTPLPAQQALDAYFLEARSRLLDLAAILDRVGRGADAAAVAADPRMGTIRAGIEALLTQPERRAEAIQRLFSQEYDPDWPRPKPR